MIKCLTVSPFKDISEFGQKSLDVILAINRCNGIVAKNEDIKLTEKQHNSLNIEQSVLDGNPDLCVQYVPLRSFVKTTCQSVGVFEPPTKGDYGSYNTLNLLDRIIVHSKRQKEILPDRVREKAIVVRPNINIPLNKDPTKKIISKFAFYVPSSGSRDANMRSVISAYFRAFCSNDNVRLSILASDFDNSINLINEVKDSLKLYSGIDMYPEVSLYKDHHTLHASSHCCIDMSYEYRINIQSMVAVKYGNPLLVMREDDISDWLPKEAYYTSEYHEDILINDKPFGDCTVVKYPHVLSLSEKMKAIYEGRELFLGKQKFLYDGGSDAFDYKEEDNIGRILCSL